MVDRSYGKLILKYCALSVPPGARIKSQMTNSDVWKRKKNANLRIHVEHAISCIKSCRILRSILPIYDCAIQL